MKKAIALLAMLAVSALAADISGTWKGTADFGGQTIERTFVFKVDGSKLTGETTSSMMGKSIITDGKVDGDNISFTITVKFQDNEMKLNYKGQVKGDAIHLTVDNPQGGQPIEWTAKKLP
jgi:hypothetical protein